MRVSELVTRLDEHRQHVGNVAVESVLSGKWEGFEGPVVGVTVEHGRAGARPSGGATVMIEGRVEDEDSPQGASKRALNVCDLITQLSEVHQSIGDVDVKLRVTGEGPRDGDLGPIIEVSSTRWTTQSLDGTTTSTTSIIISGPIER
ncbi:hypothetical protein ACTVZO_41415 [Streptomyces sp. IBSNAI002]|uniref:hypothetical protein n=1 Tax=Streptomyces sp. IBSNAI002 TaxID=3457500 RepID=UPI003FD12120